MKIVSLNIGTPKKVHTNEHVFKSGVGKIQVEKAFLTKNGFEGDGVQQTKFHGGPDRAVLFYCFEHYHKWKGEFGKDLDVPGFGENITASGLSEANAHIGDIYEIGEAVVQITQARIPCDTLSKYNEENMLLSRLIETGYTGFLARVIREGWISRDSTISLVRRLPHSMSALKTNQLYFHDRKNKKELIKLLEIDELAEAWKQKITKLLK